MSETSVAGGAAAAPAPPVALASRPAVARVAARVVVLAQLVLLALLVRAFALENAAFSRVFLLAVAGYAVQAVLPVRARLPFFVLLSGAGVGVVFGPAQGAWLVGIGLALIGLAHLPAPFAVRVALIVVAAAALAVVRAGAWPAPWSPVIWPIFGSLFMFRLIVYLYDLKNRAAPFGFWRATAYFFMLPNVCFPLFPVVDYKTMCRSYGNPKVDELQIHQTGVEWIFRGLVQLLLYRVAYQTLSSDPAGIHSAAPAALYLARPYLLYLRISGSFHLVIGMMRLFGFDLPRTNHNYFLASSFTDYWRRINIYWKEFLQKIFFNPLYFRLSRGMSANAALVVATFIAFFATWALHSYQWFWIRGSFPIAWQDIVFWSLMGAVVLGNMVREARHGRRRSLSRPKRTLRTDLGLAGRTIGTFVVICGSWAVWSAQSSQELRLVVGKLAVFGPGDALWILAGTVGLGLAAVIYDRVDHSAVQPAAAPQRGGLRLGWLHLPWSALRTGTACVGLLGLVYASLVLYYPPALADVVDRLRNPLRLSRHDQQLMDRGYYEDLTDVTRFNPELAQIYAQKPPDWDRCWAIHRTGSFPTHELLPSRAVAFKGAMMTTNRWGMRDRDYQRTKPAGTYRYALLGDSHAMGTGVGDDQTFENQVEDRLNAEAGATAPHYEILNFSVGGYGPAARLSVLEKAVFPFGPDAVIVNGINDLWWIGKEILDCLEAGLPLPYPPMVEAARAAGIDAATPRPVAEGKLAPFREQALRGIYASMIEQCRQHGARPIALYIPQPREEHPDMWADMKRQEQIATEAGFAVIDLLEVYRPAAPDYARLCIARWDGHPNAQGHRMLADALFAALHAQHLL